MNSEDIHPEAHDTECSKAFWAWLPRAYRDGDIGHAREFTKYNMEVAFLAGWQHASAAPDLAAEVLRLRDELASGSFYKESDIDAMQDEIARLREALGACAAEIFVPVATSLSGGIDHEEMYGRWRDIACERADIARAALGDSHD
jgi:lysophospholipase L1-like esterase